MATASRERDVLLFLCVANSARSQMAEGLARKLAPGWAVASAGSEPGSLNPFAVAAMAEVGIDISGHRSKGVNEIPADRVGTVVTLCAEEVCPVFPGVVTRIHWPLPDPAAASGAEDAVLASFRQVRDELQHRIEGFLAAEP